MEEQTTVTTDTQGTPPAAATTTETTSVSSMWAEAKAEAGANTPGSDAAGVESAEAPEADTGTPEAGKPEGAKPTYKYASHEEAEKANLEAQRKITEQGEELARLRKQIADTQGKTPADGQPKADASSGEEAFEELSPEEFSAFMAEDPAGAANYQRALIEHKVNQRLKTELDPIKNRIAEEQKAIENEKTLSSIRGLEESYEKENGKGSFEKVLEVLESPEKRDLIMKNPTTGKLINLLIEKGDQIEATRLMIGAAHQIIAKRAAEKAAKSVPQGTGAGVATVPTSAKPQSVRDLWAEARREQGRK